MDWERQRGRLFLQQQQQQQQQQLQQQQRDQQHGDNSYITPPPSSPPTALGLALQHARSLSLTSLKTAHVGVWSALAALYSCIGDLSAMTGAMQR